MAPVKPRRFPKPPKINLREFDANISAEGMAASMSSPDAFNRTDISRAGREGREDIAHAYKQASQGEPQFAPDAPGVEKVPFYPVEFENADGTVDGNALVGRTTPYESMRAFYGPERARENAVNLTTRNPANSDPENIYPLIHRGGAGEHFNRPIHVVRGSLSPEDNGHFHAEAGVAHWQQADDAVRRMIEHELAGHAPTLHSKSKDGTLGGLLLNDSDTWLGGKMTPVQSEIFSNLLDHNIASLDPTGRQIKARMGGVSNRAISPDESNELMENGLSGYHFRPHEMTANSLNWKNQALQVFGARLPDTKSQEINLAQSLLRENPGVSPEFQTGPRAGQKATSFNFLHAQQQTIYQYLLNTNPEAAKKYLNLIYRLGGAGGVAVLPSLLDEEAGDDAGRNQ